MDKHQEQKLSMYLVVRDFLTTNTTTLSSLPNFSVYQTAFQNAILQILSSSEQQNFSKQGIASNKSLLREALVRLTADTSRKLTAYALFNNNQVLLKEVGYSESELKKRSDTALRDAAKGVYDRAQAILTSLATYGITAMTQTNLQGALSAFNASIPKTRLGITEKRQSTLQLINYFKAADTALDNIDAALEIIRLSLVDLYNGYRTTRKLIALGRTPLSVKGSVTDSASGKPLQSVKLTFAAMETKSLAKAITAEGGVSKKSAKKGGFFLKNLAEGTYLVTASKPGYRDQTATVSVTDGEMSLLEIAMEKS